MSSSEDLSFRKIACSLMRPGSDLWGGERVSLPPASNIVKLDNEIIYVVRIIHLERLLIVDITVYN